jgi:hypothetical protein
MLSPFLKCEVMFLKPHSFSNVGSGSISKSRDHRHHTEMNSHISYSLYHLAKSHHFQNFCPEIDKTIHDEL